MLMLTAVQNGQPDYIALAIVMVLAVVVAVLTIRKKILVRRKEMAGSYEVQEPAAEEAAELPVAPGTAGEVKLHGVEPKTAAMLMAIVAHKTGKPLNELRFISVKEVE